jgi:ribosomal protein S18 acetylase RimI-like enzyme
MSLLITQLAPRELDECAAVMAAAFADDAFIAQIVPPGPKRRARLAALYRVSVRTNSFHSGLVDVVRAEENGPILGLAAWQPPQAKAPLNAHPLNTLRGILGYLRALGPSQLLRVSKIMHVLESSHPQAPHWYLEDIAVRPDARGMGVGNALLEHRLAQIDADDPHVCHLESTTPGSQRLYERHGFRVVKPLNITSDGYPMAMQRPVTPRV